MPGHGPIAHREVSRPKWFAAFLADRGTRKPSAHTIKAYRQDFDAIAGLIVGSDEDVSAMSLDTITTEAMRAAFAQYAETHEAASIQRCWSTWNVLCTFLYTAELIPASPMPLVGRPKIAKTLPKGLPSASVQALLAAIDSETEQRASDWVERDRALILTSLLAGLRADELLRANVGDVRRSDDGAVVHIRGKGGKDRRIPIEPALLEVLDDYLDIRAVRFPNTAKRRSSPASGLAAWPPSAPLFVGSDVTASPAALCNIGSCALFAAPESTETAPGARWFTDYTTHSPLSSPTPVSASTH